MGADLYIRSIVTPEKKLHEPLFKAAVAVRDAFPKGALQDKAQELVDFHYNAMYPDTGYFRDSYNGTSLLWLLDISWWQDVNDLLDKKGNLRNGNAHKLRSMIEARPITDELFQAHYDKHLKESKDSPEEWRKYFEEKRQTFLDFLQRAIDLKEPIDCSI